MKTIRVEVLPNGFRVDTIEGNNQPVPGTMFMPAQIIRSQFCETPAQAAEAVRQELIVAPPAV